MDSKAVGVVEDTICHNGCVVFGRSDSGVTPCHQIAFPIFVATQSPVEPRASASGAPPSQLVNFFSVADPVDADLPFYMVDLIDDPPVSDPQLAES